MTSPITRVTMIKLPKEEDVTLALQKFDEFIKTQQKDGKPYIQKMFAGKAEGDAKAQGYTFVTTCVFKNKEDMEFYEKECPGHEQLKAALRDTSFAGITWFYFTPECAYGI